jgi:hypothetical protein
MPFADPVSYAQFNNTPYVYVTSLDQSIQDLLVDARVSLALSAAEELRSPGCGTIAGAGDPESPVCSRLTSKLVTITKLKQLTATIIPFFLWRSSFF